MTVKENKNIFRRLSNINVLLRYMIQSANTVRQGNSLKDKFILLVHYLKIPLFVIISLVKNKLLIEVEEEYKFLAGSVTIRNKYGKYFCGNNILTVYIASAYYEKHFIPYFEIHDGLFVDVGAHIGKYTIMLANRLGVNGKVIAVEPEEINFAMLKKNIALNKLENVMCINRGAYSAAQEIPFYVTHKGGGEHSLVTGNAGWKKTIIATDTLDNMIESTQPNMPVKLIKIDAEGSEVSILEGAENIITKHHPKIILEVLKENNSNLMKVKEMMLLFSYKNMIQLDEDNYFFY